MIALPLVLLLAQTAAPAASPAPAAASARPVVALETSLGTIKIALDRDKAPVTVENFLQYVRSGHYDGTIFHRVIPNFMVQGGGFDADMKQKPTKAPIKNEASNGLKNRRATVAMARTNDPDSATSQFFINTVNNGYLDRAQAKDKVGYAVFGKVIDGMDVVDKIRRVKTTEVDGAENVPVEDVIIRSARRVEK